MKQEKECDVNIRCRRCHRKLKNPNSKKLGIGKVCEEKEIIKFYEKNQLKLF